MPPISTDSKNLRFTTRDLRYPHFLFFCFVLSLFIAIVYPIYTSDSEEYRRIAQNISIGNGFSIDRTPPYLPTAWRLPGFVSILAAAMTLSNHYTIIIYALHALLNVLTLWNLFAIFRITGIREDSFSGAFALLCLFPLLAITGTVGPEIANAALILSAYRFLLRFDDRSSLISGILFGLGTLFRTENQLILAAIALFVTLIKRCPKRASLLVIGLAFVTLPWQIRNRIKLGFWEIADPIYIYSVLPFGTNGRFDDPVSSKRNDYVRGDVTQREREDYVQLAKQTYFQRWRSMPVQIVTYKLRMYYDMLCYGLEGFFTGQDSSFQTCIKNGRYSVLFSRIASKILFGPIFFSFAMIGLVLHVKHSQPMQWLSLPFIVIMLLAAVFIADGRIMLTSRILLIPACYYGFMRCALGRAKPIQ